MIQYIKRNTLLFIKTLNNAVRQIFRKDLKSNEV